MRVVSIPLRLSPHPTSPTSIASLRSFVSSCPFSSTFASSIFLTPSTPLARSPVRPPVRSPPARKKQLKRLKSPKARREARRDRKPSGFFARPAPRFSVLLGYCDPRWNCPGQLHRNLTSIRTYYLNRGSARRADDYQLVVAAGSPFCSCSFGRRYVT